jgi:hypothetical protein
MIALAGVVAAGLATRWIRGPVSDAVGDALWSVMVYLLVRLAWLRALPVKSCVASIAISYAVEFQQLYRADWILRLRATTVGHLMLGSDFAWADLAAYLAGALAAFAVETRLRRQTPPVP